MKFPYRYTELYLTSTDNGVNLSYSDEIQFNPNANVVDSYVDTRGR